ncbi:heme ABC transporter ATP-binding protein [Cognatiyoonia sp. IB215182]|uniref:heme ABC transporter ATP-binding protein n=1 Tax=Cognatiyoonia sp. IB215182 TaxID=3097353 RepID=UPI002A1788B1|nr:heme ABC transporter ATP-binding protein [Cognatiyoonia sp. IB215182]MDX8354763.1 heme ABC transporter ATP-binding protein [Cognatiyoonia sp. IB215182]
MINARDIRVTFGKKPILHGVDFTARPGEVTAIVGPNGSGKTTLLRALTDEVRWTGQISVNHRDIRIYKPWELAAIRAVLPQAATLAFPFTVIEVVRLGLMSGIHGGKDRIAQYALQQVGLAGYENRFFQELSGGEQQRAHLARVLCQVWDPVIDGVPRWLLLDEPVASLDIGHQLLIMNCVQNFARRGGGVVAVMHDLNLTAMVADAVTMIARGEAIAQGPVAEVFTDHRLSAAYQCELKTNAVPPNASAFILPQTAALRGH